MGGFPTEEYNKLLNPNGEYDKQLSPLGLKPRYIHELKRLQDITEAINRLEKANEEIPHDWFIEYVELSTKLMKEGKL